MRFASLRFRPATFLAVCAVVGIAAQATAQEAQPRIPWAEGPHEGQIGQLATIDVPQGYLFTGGDGTRTLMELMQNPVSGLEMGTLAPASDNEDWFLVFEWEEIGWVDDSEKDDLDPEGLLSSIREGTAAANQERERRGWATLDIVGWREQPHYDEATNNLTWAIHGQSEGEAVINRIVKLLGRRGVMTVTLVSSPDQLAGATLVTDHLLKNYEFNAGQTYAEFVEGSDKIAQFGLGALIVGGATAAVIKSGLLARFWKVIVVGAAGLVAGVRKLFSRG